MSTETNIVNNPSTPKIDMEAMKAAKQEIEDVCKKHSIVLIPVVVHQGDRTISSIEIAPVISKEEAEKLQAEAKAAGEVV